MGLFYQCRMQRKGAETVGWIEERAAKEGAIIKLETDKKFWRVAKVYTPGIEERALQKKQVLGPPLTVVNPLKQEN